tara:strand:- start:325 stop:1356 length:1032 start_codon:yes stop_codon:yes gene_type:complete
MAPLKSSFNRSAGKLLAVFNQRDLGKDGLLGDREDPVAPNPPIYDETYILIVAGGASGGSLGGGYSNSIGGGGGGGVLHNVGGTAITVSPGVTYTITIGEGGAQVPNSGPEAPGNNGSNSTVSYPHPTGTKTWTASGGGRGIVDSAGGPGGSGGGGSAGGHAGGEGTQGPQPTPIGTLTGYGNDGGEGMSGAPATGGGGGGAGAAGQDATAPKSGNGGAGTPVTISGSPVLYGAGGGAGGSNPTPTGGEGGAGGGGDGGDYGSPGGAGTANTGSGGGSGGSGGPNAGSGGAGGDGVVVFRIPLGLANVSSHSNRSSATPVPGTGGVPNQVTWTWNGPGSFTVG